jgi:hypothetical protein
MPILFSSELLFPENDQGPFVRSSVVAPGVGVGEIVGAGVAVGVGEGVTDIVGVGVGVVVTVGVGLAVGVGVALGVGVGVTDPPETSTLVRLTANAPLFQNRA